MGELVQCRCEADLVLGEFYDVWDVSLLQAEQRPLTGQGSEGYTDSHAGVFFAPSEQSWRLHVEEDRAGGIRRTGAVIHDEGFKAPSRAWVDVDFLHGERWRPREPKNGSNAWGR